MPARFANRIVRAQQAMTETGCDVLVVTNRENLIYFTGVTQIECMAVLIPRQGEPCAITLWLDADYVREQSGLVTHGYLFPRQDLGATLVKHIHSFPFADPVLGFEKYFVDFAVYDALRQAFPESRFKGVGELFYRLRAVKDERELLLLRQAAVAARQGMRAALQTVRPGVTELDVLAEAEYAMLKAGSWGASFRPQVVAGERTLLAHPTASDRKIAAGEAVVIHLSATCAGYCAKMARTAAMGDIPAGQQAVHALLLKALQQAEAALRPGAAAGDVHAAARRVVEAAGYGSSYPETSGYGVGLRQSEFYPVLGRDRTELIEAGMVIDLLLSTVFRKDIGGPRVTDVILVGETGNEVLTAFPRDLFRV